MKTRLFLFFWIVVTASLESSTDTKHLQPDLPYSTDNSVSTALPNNTENFSRTLGPLTYYSPTFRGQTVDLVAEAGTGTALVSNFASSPQAGSLPVVPGEGPGGPVLILVDSWNPFSRYYAEILRAEGLNYFTVMDISLVTPTTLKTYDLVILGQMLLTDSQATVLTEWVSAGGNLIAMRPDRKLGKLLGLSDAKATLSDAYLLVNTSSGPGVGIVNQTIQFHGSADCYTLNGAMAIATLYSRAADATSFPAVTQLNIGQNGGQAAAFTYDLARSIVYTRQGNPQWSGQDRDGAPPIRSDDLFFGDAGFDAHADWIDLKKVHIPGADEQQRLLANMIIKMNLARKPLPRFWYFPKGKKAIVIMTGDDHAGGGTSGRFDVYKANSPVGCSVPDWECIRSTSYIYPGSPLTNSQATAYTADGFEVALHVNTDCHDWTPDSLESSYSSQLASWKSLYPGLPSPTTNRTHCVVWSDYVTQAQVELKHGIRLDTNYYYYPPKWMSNRPGFFTGSGMPMRFANSNGRIIDVYQAATQMTDESGQVYPETVDTLLDRAIGPEGYYGAFTANIHTDNPTSDESDAIVSSTKARGVPVVSARQMLEWLNRRNSSSFRALSMSGNTLSFSISSPLQSMAFGLQGMLPTDAPAGTLVRITFAGKTIPYTTQSIKGIRYALFVANPGNYVATYAVGANPLPETTGITPGSVSPGGEGLKLQVNGGGFLSSSVVRWNGTALMTTLVSPTRLEAAVPAADVAREIPVSVTVFNPPPGGGVSNPQKFSIGNPTPMISSIDPVSTDVGVADFTLTVLGRDFVASSIVRWNGIDHPTQFVSSQRLTAKITSLDISAVGSIPVSVFNPAPGGGQASLVEFMVTSSKTLLLDNFSDGVADGWAVSPFSPLGNAEGWKVVKQVYRYDGSGHTQSCRGDVSWTDYKLEVNVRLTVHNDYPGGIRGRLNPLTGTGYAVWQYPGSRRIVLYRVTGWDIDSPGLTQLGVYNGIFFDKHFHKLEISFLGSSISVYRDGELIISATDATYSHGLIALDVANQIVEFDNVMVTNLLP